jgi:hypothetical protein
MHKMTETNTPSAAHIGRPKRQPEARVAPRSHSIAISAGVTIGALVASALFNLGRAKKAERDNPPTGKFIEVGGVRLHYVECGEGEALVLLHGNGSMIEDFQSSGLIEMAAKKYRVIVFDRPGFGHSDRPRSTVWSPEAQANLFNAALRKIGVSRAVVLATPGARPLQPRWRSNTHKPSALWFWLPDIIIRALGPTLCLRPGRQYLSSATSCATRSPPSLAG